MKKTLFAAMAATLLFGSHAMAAKVTYDDAVESSSGFYEANNAVNKAPSISGLGPEETQTSTGSANQMGKWVKIGGSLSVTSAGSYATLLASSAVGQACLKGEKGLIMDSDRYCTSTSQVGSGNGNYRCNNWIDYIAKTGFKAECR